MYYFKLWVDKKARAWKNPRTHPQKRERERETLLRGGDFMEELHGQINHTILWTFDELLVVFLGYVLIVGDAKHETRVF